MEGKWWKVTDENLLGFLRAKEVKADLSNFYVGEMVDVIVDGKQLKRRCFDTPSGNTINIKGYRVCYDDFDEPVEEIESKLNERRITTMQMDWNTIKNNRIIKSSEDSNRVYTYYINLENTGYYEDGYLRIIPGEGDDTRFKIEATDEDGNVIKEGVFKFDDLIGAPYTSDYDSWKTRPYSYYINLVNTGYYESPILRITPSDGDLTEFRIEVDDENGNMIKEGKFDFGDILFDGIIANSREVIKSSEDSISGLSPRQYRNAIDKAADMIINGERDIQKICKATNLEEDDVQAIIDEQDELENELNSSREVIKSESSWNKRIQEIMDEEGVTREEAENILADACQTSSRQINSSVADPNRTKLYEMVDEGILDSKQVALELIQWLSDDDCEEFMRVYEYSDDFDSEEIDSGCHSKPKKNKKKPIKSGLREDFARGLQKMMKHEGAEFTEGTLEDNMVDIYDNYVSQYYADELEEKGGVSVAIDWFRNTYYDDEEGIFTH